MPTISGISKVTQSGTYVLTKDIVLPYGYTGAAIEIAADNVTIDLAGHTIIAAGDPWTVRAVGVYALDKSGITIKNGVISQCFYGIKLETSSALGLSDGAHTITDLTITASTFRAILADGHDNVISDNVIWKVGGTGVFADAYSFGIEVHGPRATVTGNSIREVYANGTGEAVGVSLSHNSVGSIVSDNTIVNSDFSAFRSFALWCGGGSSVTAENNIVGRYHYALGGFSTDGSPIDANVFSDVPYDSGELWRGGTIGTNASNETLGFFSSGGTINNDRLIAAAGGDVVFGLGGNDRIFGQEGNDELHGHAGLDVMYGGGGDDTFVFDTRCARSNLDTIVDYRQGNDHIELHPMYFAKVVAATGDVRISNTGPHGRQALLTFDPKTDILSYDPDGIGRAVAQPFAKLVSVAKLTADDFII